MIRGKLFSYNQQDSRRHLKMHVGVLTACPLCYVALASWNPDWWQGVWEPRLVLVSAAICLSWSHGYCVQPENGTQTQI